MPTWKPDPTFYPSPRLAMKAPPERLAYVAVLNTGGNGRPDAIVVADTDPSSPTYGRLVGRTDMPNAGDELHHFGWNACSSALCPYAPHPHVERRYLLVPGLRSSRIHVLDVKPDPRQPRIVKVIEPEELAEKAGYSRPHTSHCGPDGIYMSALGSPDGGGPGGIFVLDHDSLDVLGRWEVDRGPQHLAYDFAWHLGHDVLITSEWGTPDMIEGGLNPELLLAGRYGRALHVWDLRKRRHLQTLDLGGQHQMVLELRPAHDPTRPYGFVGVVVSLEDLSASVWLWSKAGSMGGNGAAADAADGARGRTGGVSGGNGSRDGEWEIRKVIHLPAEPADPALLPPALKPFGAVPPLVTDIDLSVDDRFLYVSCWGTGEFRQYDVSNPLEPRLTASMRLGGITARAPHPVAGKLNGGPQMVEVSRDGRRVYLSNSLYASWDAQFFPEGVRGWVAKLDAGADGGLQLDERFFLQFEGERPHQIRLEGGDASSDSYCFP
ncbi:MAG: selenium-binding protein [Gemmatimonadetes bacterium]|nr:selenium-binding protein [Gemmatimonadota bacterium]